MASFQLFFSPRSIESFVSIIRPVSEELTILEARLLGRAGDLEEGFDSAAVHFTDLIGWDIKSLGSEDYQAWVDAAVNLRFARDVNDMWADYVQEFWDTRNEIWDDWDAAVEAKAAQVPAKYQGTTITSTVPDPAHWFDSDAKKCRELYDELSGYLEEIKEREQANWDRHEENAIEISSMLLQGPTGVNVQKLIDGGYANMAYANLDPDKYLFLESDFDLSPESAEQTADELAPYWSGEKPLDDRYHELMLVMGMIGTNARTAQNDGKPLDSEEMAFLDAFYERLEVSRPGGVIDIPKVIEGAHMTDEEREYALGVLGDGLLALSDHGLGGGYYDLPASVREAAEGPHLAPTDGTPPSSHSWAEDARALAAMLGQAHESMEPGYGLAMTLSLSMGMYSEEYSEVMDQFIPEDDVLSLIDVVNRNHDAIHDLFAGVENENGEREPYVHPNLIGTYQDAQGEFQRFSPHTEQWGSPQEMINTALEGLFTHPWEDKGETVGDMVEWIAQDAHSENEEESDRAGRAAAGFIETITTKEMQEALTSTSVNVNEDGKHYNSATFTAFNTELAENLADVFDAYIYSFAASEVIDPTLSGSVPFEGVGIYDSEINNFMIGSEERAAYIQYLMGNDDTAIRTFGSASAYQKIEMEAYLQTGKESHAHGAASLYALIDVALDAEAENRKQDLQKTENLKEKLYSFGIDKTAEYAGKIPAVGESIEKGLNLGSGWITSHFIDENITTSPRLPISTDTEDRKLETRLIFLEHIVNSENVAIKTSPPQEKIDILVEYGVATKTPDGTYEFEIDKTKWDTTAEISGGTQEIKDAVSAALKGTQIFPENEDLDIEDARSLHGEFWDAHEDRFDSVQKHAPR